MILKAAWNVECKLEQLRFRFIFHILFLYTFHWLFRRNQGKEFPSFIQFARSIQTSFSKFPSSLEISIPNIRVDEIDRKIRRLRRTGSGLVSRVYKCPMLSKLKLGMEGEGRRGEREWDESSIDGTSSPAARPPLSRQSESPLPGRRTGGISFAPR